jgi:hypothetical protein
MSLEAAQSGPIQDAFISAAAALLCIPEQYQQITTQHRYVITNIHCI